MGNPFDLIIIGGGHAGIEAAWMASQFNLNVAIITMPKVPLASTPCNPSIGGVGKGQVVREIDALGGIMGKLTDRTGIQWRILNESKGYAVRSTRVQIDKKQYPKEAEKVLRSCPQVSIIQEKVENIEKECFFTVKTTKSQYLAKKLIVTTGTFLGGKLHVGNEQIEGGRPNCEASKGLKGLFEEIQTNHNRFKTGTPPRLDGRTIDFTKLIEQKTNDLATTFHFAHGARDRFLKQVPCYLTKTNERTLEVIKRNKDKSPLYNGQIKAVGARYCPSVEDKAHRYPHRNSHHIFVEPESLEGYSFYPSGISSSLPKEVQGKFIQTIIGFEQAEILLYGHAVEYDVVDTAMLDETLQYRTIQGLYFAGQINGTSGYEEAAGQGLVAGANAALALLGKEPLILSREHSYIGVMIEDLVSNQRDEPYRLFTARCENRLFVREDNAYYRMAPYRAKMGLNQTLDSYQKGFIDSFDSLNTLLSQYRYTKSQQKYFQEEGFGPLNREITLRELLMRSHLDPVVALKKELPSFYSGPSFDERVLYAVGVSAKYEGHIQKDSKEREKLMALSRKRIDWQKIAASSYISNECRERVKKIRPSTFSGLQQIHGIRPATLAFVAQEINS